ncbi:hypothetical protein LUZ60_011940 [Juncus effusus]|nr:hypothetical protein LUZ60_011940 [Juncus effusus]
MASGNPKALRKIITATIFLFRSRFNASKCKAEAKMATARIKLLRNKRKEQILQMKRDIAKLLESGQEDIARIRVEHVIREQNILAANEIIELFCDLVVNRLPIITKEKQCPADLKEGISSLIYAAPRCSELPELLRIRDIFEKKYGKDFSLGASELRPDSCVNRLLIEKLSVKKPSGETKLKAMKAIAKECNVNWDPAETELELLKLPEERLSGPSSFVIGVNLPVRMNQPRENEVQYGSNMRYTSFKEDEDSTATQFTNPRQNNNSTPTQFSNSDEDANDSTAMQFTDTASAARAAAEFAAKAAQAASSAAQLSKQERENSQSFKSTKIRFSLNGSNGSVNQDSESCAESEEVDSKRVFIKFDESDEEEEIEGLGKRSGEERESSGGSKVHPKMPDYDELTARFEKLRSSGGIYDI